MAGVGKRGPDRTKLDEPQVGKILAAIVAGRGRMKGCEIAGVSYSTMQRRMQEDEPVVQSLSAAVIPPLAPPFIRRGTLDV